MQTNPKHLPEHPLEAGPLLVHQLDVLLAELLVVKDALGVVGAVGTEPLQPTTARVSPVPTDPVTHLSRPIGAGFSPHRTTLDDH